MKRLTLRQKMAAALLATLLVALLMAIGAAATAAPQHAGQAGTHGAVPAEVTGLFDVNMPCPDMGVAG